MYIFKIFGIKIAINYKEVESQAWEVIPKQKARERISKQEIRTILRNETKIELKTIFKNSDIGYKKVDIKQLEKFVIKNNLARFPYIKEERDCDDFSFMLIGGLKYWDSDLAAGIIWGEDPEDDSHAFNWVIGTDNKIWFIEPQTNTVFRPKKLWEITELVM